MRPKWTREKQEWGKWDGNGNAGEKLWEIVMVKELFIKNGLIIANTKFRHKNNHKFRRENIAGRKSQ